MGWLDQFNLSQNCDFTKNRVPDVAVMPPRLNNPMMRDEAISLGKRMAGLDIRSRGFTERTRLETAVNSLLHGVEPLPYETVVSAHSCDRTLAMPVCSPRDVPSFARSAMDGFALSATDTIGATESSPVLLRLEGESRAGHPPNFTVQSGGAARIMTGAALPDGTDAVVPIEACRYFGTTVEIHESVVAGRHVCAVGEDFQRGQTVLKQGRRLHPQDLAILSALGLFEVPVVRQPRVLVLVTGDEILPAFSEPAADRVSDANSPMLKALIQRDGGLVAAVAMVPDTHRELSAALAADHSADLILISGGSSVGQEDHAPVVLAELGTIEVHGLALRPASPAGFGRLKNGIRVMLLPGNPVSCFCAYELLAGRLIRRMAGRPDSLPHPAKHLQLAHAVKSVEGRTDFLRVRIVNGQVETIPGGASMLSTVAMADGFVLIPHDSAGYSTGNDVAVHLFEHA
jgi:molybdopterin molybdotransferase